MYTSGMPERRPASTRPFSVDDAHALARRIHAGQKDQQGRDYYTHHLLPVAQILIDDGEDDLTVIAGLLHDAIEDDPATTAETLLAEGVPAESVEAVVAVSRIPDEPYMDLIRRARQHPRGRKVKLADNQHNIRCNAELAKTEPARAKRLLSKRYLPAREILLA